MKQFIHILLIGLTAAFALPGAQAEFGLMLDFDGLMPLESGYVYEGWLIVDGNPISTGTFTITEGGIPQPATIPVDPAVAEDSTAFVVTIEPEPDPDPAPSNMHILAGDFMEETALLTVDHESALGVDFMAASAEYILNTPSTMAVPDDYDQGIWYLDPDTGPGPSLVLPLLPEGWIYEGWVVGMEGPVSTGRFADATGPDSDGAGDAAGPDPVPDFPGQDFIDPAKVLTMGYSAVISIEPDPDTGPAPFVLKPFVDSEIDDVGAGMLQPMDDNTAEFPVGSALFGDIVTVNISLMNVEPLGPDFVYEGWLVGDTPVSTGVFTMDDEGNITPDIFYVQYTAAVAAEKFVLSIEPVNDPDPAPSSTKLLAGVLEQSVTNKYGVISTDDSAALGTKFAQAYGEYILNTPSSAETADYNQGIWFLDPDAGPGESLILPELPEGWVYEGWVVNVHGPVTTGRFTDPAAPDSDMGGPAAGPEDVPPFPGQDFIDPPKILTDGHTAVISVEPEPDNSPDPFFLKPLTDLTINDVGAGTLQSMMNTAENLPYGAVLVGTPDLPDMGFDLLMDNTLLEGGDIFHLHYNLHNPGIDAYMADVWIILDVYENYFLYPSWVNLEDGIDFEEAVTAPAVTSLHKTVLLFQWPYDVGSASNLYFYGAAFHHGTFDFIGDLGTIEWAYQ